MPLVQSDYICNSKSLPIVLPSKEGHPALPPLHEVVFRRRKAELKL